MGLEIGKRAVVLDLNGTIVIFAYIAPSDPDQLIVDLVRIGERWAGASGAATGRDVLICGDLNARSEELSGDSMTNRRGTMLEETLDHSVFSVVKPVEGKWTSFGRRGGKGIPDILLSTFPIKDMRVLEQESIGGSDHAPITFSIDRGPPLLDKHIRRWNIRKLQRPQARKRYVEALEADSELGELKSRCEAAEWALTRAGGLTDCQAHIDNLASTLYDAIKNAAEKSIGYLEWSNRIAEDFEDEVHLAHDLRELEEAVRKARRSALDDEAPSASRKLQAEAAKKAGTYRAGALKKRASLFQSYFDDLASENASGFLRAVKGIKKRRDK
ncbi:hypothetical protein HDU93_006328, partial [Gonapodya sp. JEL0774]